MRDALALFPTLDAPGHIVDLGYSWDAEWKREARRPHDERSPRNDTPQYQNRADETAATRRYGSSIACGVCVPSLTPRL